MIARIFLLILLLTAFSPAHASTDLFTEQFDYVRFNQLAGPDLMGQDWQEDGKYAISMDYTSSSAETFYRGTELISIVEAQTLYTNLVSQLDHRQFDVTITSGITATANFILRISAADKTVHVIDPTLTATKIQRKGLNDIYAGFVIKNIDNEQWRLNTHLGFYFPTGLTNIKGAIGSNTEQTLGYPMQFGHNSMSLAPGVSISRYFYRWSLGVEGQAILPLLANDQDYLLGKELHLRPWVSAALGKHVSVYGMAHYQKVTVPQSAHPDMDDTVDWTRDVGNVGGSRLDLGVGAYLHLDWGWFKHYKVYVEQRQPVSRNLNGVQLQHESQIRFGLRYGLVK